MTRDEILNGLKEGKVLVSYRNKRIPILENSDQDIIDNLVKEGLIDEREIINRDDYIGYDYKIKPSINVDIL